VVPKAGKEGRLTLKQGGWLGETAIYPFKHLKPSILTEKYYLFPRQDAR